jgi:hypothetical protein
MAEDKEAVEVTTKRKEADGIDPVPEKKQRSFKEAMDEYHLKLSASVLNDIERIREKIKAELPAGVTMDPDYLCDDPVTCSPLVDDHVVICCLQANNSRVVVVYYFGRCACIPPRLVFVAIRGTRRHPLWRIPISSVVLPGSEIKRAIEDSFDPVIYLTHKSLNSSSPS